MQEHERVAGGIPYYSQGRILESYRQLWIREKRKLKDELAIKRKKKVAFLTEKYSKKRVTPDVVEGTTSLSAPEVKKFVPSGCYEVT